MTTEELTNLRELAQQCCDTWANILGLRQWSIVVALEDKTDLIEIPDVEYDALIASAKVTVVTGDAWKQVYPDFWAPYNMEVHIIYQLLRIMMDEPVGHTYIYHLARVLFDMKNRGDVLQHMIEEQNSKVESKETVEVIEPEVEDPEMINHEEELVES